MDIGKNQRARISGDIAAGATTALFGLPGNMVFGLIAFAPLGDAYTGMGIMAAMVSTIILCLISASLGNAPGMISGPKAATAVIFASVAAQAAGFGLPPALMLALPLVMVLLSGLMQVLVGLFRLGNVAKYIPYPVLAGILNGTAIIVLLSQTGPVLGIEQPKSLADLWTGLSLALPMNTGLVLFSCLVVIISPKLVKGVPGALLAIPLGTLLYHLFESAGFQGMMGPVMGQMTFIPPDLSLTRSMWDALYQSSSLEYLPGLAFTAATLAILNAMGTLLAVLSIQDRTRIKPDINRLMMAEGLGNMVSSCLGGLSGSGLVVRSRINYHAGGRTRLSGMVCALVVLFCIIFFTPLISNIPRAVITGVLLMSVVGIIDKWSLSLFKKFITGGPDMRRQLSGNIMVILFVMLVCLFFNPVAAVLLGILVSMVMFMMEVNKSLVRREYRSNTVPSKMYRNEAYMELLRIHGHRIAVLELEGPLFFGSADTLASRIERLCQDRADWVILDMKRVTTIDGTGARIIARTVRSMQDENRTIAAAYAPQGSAVCQFLTAAGLKPEHPDQVFFRDTDMALEYFEECLLDEICPGRNFRNNFQLSSFGLLRDLTPKQLDRFSAYLNQKTYDREKTVFSQGDAGDAFYFILQGSVDVTINVTAKGKSRKKRLQILSAGTIFGEMALIDGKPRSADITARENLTCFEMGLDQFNELKRRHPDIAVLVFGGMARILSERLRSSHAMISELEI